MAQASSTERFDSHKQTLIQTTTDADANSTSTVTSSILAPWMDRCALDVRDESGAHTTHVVKVQTSIDGTNWNDESNSVTGEGSAENTGLNARMIRAKVTTAEGGASKVTITLIVN